MQLTAPSLVADPLFIQCPVGEAGERGRGVEVRGGRS
jgi:hypothetical protein